MTSPLVSIITPTYNQEMYIDDCIGSVLGQSYENWEMLVVDDASTDRTGDRVAACRDPRVRLIQQPHRGLAGLADTYNVALSLARGSLIAILEGDDFWPKARFEKLLPLFDDEDVVLGFGVTQLTTTGGEPIARYIPDRRLIENRDALTNRPRGSASVVYAMGTTFSFPVSVVIRRAALEGIGGFIGVAGLPYVDLPTFLRLSVEGSFGFVDEVTGFWRQRLGSGTRTRDEEVVAESLLQHVKDFYRDEGRRLRVDPPALHDLESHHRRVVGDLLVSQGRRLLLQRDWGGARKMFGRAFRLPTSAGWTRRRAIAGMIASRLHVSLEPLVGALAGIDADLRYVYSNDRQGRSDTLG